MIKAGILTFHASHNYGSSLQAYAIQNAINSLGVQNKIINLRTKRQKDLYSVLTKRWGLKYVLKNTTHLVYYKSLKRKYDKFEKFIAEELDLTESEFSCSDDIRSSGLRFDSYVVGSDQIWNPIPLDFDWAYYLDFVDNGKKISYAPSFGPFSLKANSEIKEKISHYLSQFNNISVRENKSLKDVEQLCDKPATVLCDPTLLIDAEQWGKLSEDGVKINKDYIFFYTLFADKEMIKMAKILSDKLKMPIVVSNFSNQYDFVNGFIKKYDSGPKDFLSLIKNAKFVFVSSFHGTVFSIMFKKPFFAIRGMNDSRISTLLENFGLNNRAVDIQDIESKCEDAFNINFSDSEAKINELKQQGLDFLRKAFGLK